MTRGDGAAPRRRVALALAAAVVAAFAARALVGLRLNVEGGVHRGFDFYGFMADHVLDGRGLVWAFYDDLGDKWANRAPLYPLLVAAAGAAFGRGAVAAVVLVQAAVGAVAVLAPAALAARWGGSRAAVVAAWAAALWPYSVAIDTALVEHVVYAPLVVLATLATLRATDGVRSVPALVAGAVAGLATMARLTFAATAVFLFVACAVRSRRAKAPLLFAAGLLVVLTPWFVRNHAVTGAWTLGTDGGRALFVGNHPRTFNAYPAFTIDDAEREIFRHFSDDDWRELRERNGDEIAQEAVFRGRAVAAIRASPGRTAWGGLRKAGALWSPVKNPGPEAPAKALLYGASLLALFGGVALAAAFAPRVRADLPALIGVAASFTVVSAVFWGESRYLAALHGLALAAAAAGLAAALERRRAAA